jgi:adenosine deaminase
MNAEDTVGATSPDSKSQRLTRLLAAAPKSDLHVHLDGSLRLSTLIELAGAAGVALPAATEAGLREKVFKPHYNNLAEYLEGFRYTVAVLQSEAALERATFELCEDAWREGVCYLEIRFAPQLHVSPSLSIEKVVHAVAAGIARAERTFAAEPRVIAKEWPPFRAGIIFCALRMFAPEFSACYRGYFDACGFSPKSEVYARASLDLARAAVHLKNVAKLPVVGFDLAGQEKGYPADTHEQAFQAVHEAFVGKTVHAGEDYGPESIFMAIGDLHADRIGHGTWLLDPARVTDPSIKDPQAFIEALAQYVADRRITIEVCLTSNQQTVPELAGDLRRHPFAAMVRRRLSTTICTDNRLVSNTTVTREWQRAVETFELSAKEVHDILAYGFKRSFFPAPYLEKRAYVRTVLDALERVFREHDAESLLPAKARG